METTILPSEPTYQRPSLFSLFFHLASSPSSPTGGTLNTSGAPLPAGAELELASAGRRRS